MATVSTDGAPAGAEGRAAALEILAAETDNTVALLDRQGRVRWVNRRFSEVTGYAPEELLGERWGDALHDAELDAEPGARIGEQLERGERFEVEQRGRRKDGAPYWIQLTVHPIHEGRGGGGGGGRGRGHGEVSGFVSIGRDVTERVQLAQALRAEREMVATILDAVPHPIFWKDRGSVYLGCNRAAAAAAGLEGPSALVGKTDYDLPMPPEQAALVRAEDQAVMGGAPEIAHERTITIGGVDHVIIISKVPLHDGEGAVRGVLAVSMDMTKKRRIQADLRRTEERWEMAFQGCGDGVCEYDRRTGRAYYSPRLKELLGYSEAQIGSGRTDLLDLFHPDDLAGALAAWQRHAEGAEPAYAREVRVRCADGAYRWFLHRGKAIERGADGAPLRVVGTLSDIGERKRLEESLRKAKEEAEAGARAKAEFLATMSHELRTPMNGVLGFTNLLLGTGLDDEQRGFVETIQRSGDDLLRIINDVLDLGKIEAGKLDIEEIAFDLRQAAREVLDLVRPRALEKRLALRLTLQPDGPGRVVSDPGRVRQVLLNLVGNAVKFTESGGVTVEVGGAGGRMVVRVIDTGIGVPEARRAALFAPFTQGDASTSRRFGGTGLGLAICRQLAGLLGGAVGFESEAGRGSTFWLELPWRPAGELPSAPVAAQGSSSGPGDATPWRLPLRVLAVDDNPTNLLLARRMVEKLGGQVTVAQNGLEAVALCQQMAFDLILMDCQMPEMDGLEATGCIRAMEERDGTAQARVPIVALTASTMPGDRERCLGAGMDDYLRKPIVPDELRRALARWAPAP